MALEFLVKMNLPLTGTFSGIKVGKKGYFSLPVEIKRTFAIRQDVSRFAKCLVFRANYNEGPVLSKITDMPEDKEYADFKVQFCSRSGRYMLSRTPESGKVKVIGHGNYIEVLEDR